MSNSAEERSIRDFASSKALLRSGLIFRGDESGVDCDNIELHIQGITNLSISGEDAEHLCAACEGYGLEYLHLLECPSTPEPEGEVPVSDVPYTLPRSDPNGWNPTEAFRPKINPALWLQRFDTRSELKETCPTCRLFRSLLPPNSEGPWRLCWVGYGYYRIEDDHNDWGKRDDLINWRSQRTPAIIIAPEEPSDWEEWWSNRTNFGLVLPTRKRDEDPAIPRARCIAPRSVDLDVAKSWMQACSGQHENICSTVFPTSSPSRLLNCRTKTVVPASKECKYAALSYVGDVDDIVTPQDLPEWDHVPVLFRDAVTATIQLGYDYLWVDVYCEVQGQDRNRDKIFTTADVTIIAASSDNTSIGLAGMSSNDRQESAVATVGQSNLVAVQPSKVQSIAKSEWYSRARQNKEGILSRRRLVFTHNGLYFQCSGGRSYIACATESLDIAFGTAGLRTMVNDPSLFPDIGSFLPDAIWDCLGMYTGKKLTTDVNILDQFSGFLDRFAEIFSDFHHMWGVPIYRKRYQISTAPPLAHIMDYTIPPTRSEQLVSSLLWQPADADLLGPRRADFPTWSWPNVHGTIECGDLNVRNLDLKISVELADKEHMQIDDLLALSVEERPAIAKGLYIDAHVTNIQVYPIFRREDGQCFSVTSFERRDSRTIRHAGLMPLRRWPQGFKPGKHLAIILGTSRRSMTSRLTYHLLVLHEKEGHYERALTLDVNDATLEQRIPDEEIEGQRNEASAALGGENVFWMYADHAADFGFDEAHRDDWEKAFLIAKYLVVEKRVVLVR